VLAAFVESEEMLASCFWQEGVLTTLVQQEEVVASLRMFFLLSLLLAGGLSLFASILLNLLSCFGDDSCVQLFFGDFEAGYESWVVVFA